MHNRRLLQNLIGVLVVVPLLLMLSEVGGAVNKKEAPAKEAPAKKRDALRKQ